MSQETLGKLIRNAREQRHWSQAKLAEELGVVSLTVIRWEKYGKRPRSDMQQRLIEVLGLSAEIFITPPKKPPERIAESQAVVEALPQADIDILPQASKKTYQGWRQREWDENDQVFVEKIHVTVDGQPLVYFNVDGPFGPKVQSGDKLFEWGYPGAGPRALATAILADYFSEKSPQGWASREEYQAVRYRYDFKDDFVQWFPEQTWEITSEEIKAWLKDLKEREKSGAT